MENLLSNDSGRHRDMATDDRQLPAAPDMDAFAVGLPQAAPPGTVWTYNNAAIQTLDVVVREATGTDTVTSAGERLFEPLGMDDSRMTTDQAGNTGVFIGLQATCEDMARFGHRFLRGGEWDGTQVVPEDRVEAATGAPSQDLNAAYGDPWWLNRRGAVLGPVQASTARPGGDAQDTQPVPGAPEDTYVALGSAARSSRSTPAPRPSRCGSARVRRPAPRRSTRSRPPGSSPGPTPEPTRPTAAARATPQAAERGGGQPNLGHGDGAARRTSSGRNVASSTEPSPSRRTR